MNRDDIIRTIAELLIRGDIMPWNPEKAARERLGHCLQRPDIQLYRVCGEAGNRK
ncbi:MAG: hypothetical protein ACLFS7_04710 [Desulfosudaceae bacterium]